MVEEAIVVQGDSYGTFIYIDDMDPDLIDSVIFTSQSLSLRKELIYSEDYCNWGLQLSSEETSKFRPGVHSYDITIILEDGTILTCPGFYKARLRVLRKESLIK